MRKQIIALLGTPIGALSIVMVVEGCAFLATTYFGTPPRYQTIVLTCIPAITYILYVTADFVRNRLEQRVQVPNAGPESIVVYQLVNTWGPPLGDLQEFISFTERRLEASEDALTVQKEGVKSNLIDLIVIGYKCVSNSTVNSYPLFKRLS